MGMTAFEKIHHQLGLHLKLHTLREE